MSERKPKILIAGISGFLGYNLALHLRKDYLVSGLYFRHDTSIPDIQTFPVDPKKMDLLEPLVRVQAPDIIINAVGLTDRKAIEDNPKLADSLNTLMPVTLAGLANKLRAKFIQLSCAFIYDGLTGNYSEESTDFAMTDEYGKQKLSAESFIRSQTLESTILRLAKVSGMGHPYHLSEFDRVRTRLAGRQKMEASQKKLNSYFSIRSFLHAVSLILAGEFPHKHRIFNLGGANMTEFDFYNGWAELVVGASGLIKPKEEADKRNLTVKCDAFLRAFPEWKQETRQDLYFNLLQDLCPGGTGIKKWQKTLQIP